MHTKTGLEKLVYSITDNSLKQRSLLGLKNILCYVAMLLLSVLQFAFAVGA